MPRSLPDRGALVETLSMARQTLLAERSPDGHWVGRLSSSALSTATAAFALRCIDRRQHADLIGRAVDWLIGNANQDGGWGDTPDSPSNISTTLLCWAALEDIAGASPANRPAEVVSSCRAWLRRRLGSLEPSAIVAALRNRYGDDRTFAVPILTMLALAGRLGPADQAWRLVEQLPFELAAVPHGLWKWLRLPVVSYALPALIAIGQARHLFRPSRNPLARLLRNLLIPSTLGKLRQIQPASGGYLEAAPLTSFVAMCLAATGGREPEFGQEPLAAEIIAAGARFLADTVGQDGSWPIDTNLSIWVTTLSIKALAASGDIHNVLSPVERDCLVDWLLAGQHRVEHPFTRAAAGGWAWTDLPGGVPDADDTAGALLAIHDLAKAPGPRYDHGRAVAAAGAGALWLADLQNRDGGIPTFCRGWGRLPFDRSGADLTAHAIAAWQAWREIAPGLQARLTRAIQRARGYLAKQQSGSGTWLPLWFGDQAATNEMNETYGTARVVGGLSADDHPMRQCGADWLCRAQNDDGGWGGGPGLESSIEETAVAVEALATCADGGDETAIPAMLAGCAWLGEKTRGGTHFPARPIGLYFARLWYSERLYPVIFTVAALGRALRAISRQSSA